MGAIRSDPETSFTLAVNTVELHQLLHTLLADTNPVGQQNLPDPRPAVAATAAGMSDADVYE